MKEIKDYVTYVYKKEAELKEKARSKKLTRLSGGFSEYYEVLQNGTPLEEQEKKAFSEQIDRDLTACDVYVHKIDVNEIGGREIGRIEIYSVEQWAQDEDGEDIYPESITYFAE